jgi:hypothetical protein
MRLVARPIDVWPGKLTPDHLRTGSPFKASWSDTVGLLEREAEKLGVRDEVVMQLAITERDCRLDGGIRADAKPTHPGVIVSFESRHGPLRYSTDLFFGGHWGARRLPGWQANVRAVALGLEALRKVDRYGIAKGGEQYVGYRALGAGTPMPTAKMTVEEAARLLADAAMQTDENMTMGEWHDLAERGEGIEKQYRRAVRRLHPDAGGDPETFRRLTEARDLLLREAGRCSPNGR